MLAVVNRFLFVARLRNFAPEAFDKNADKKTVWGGGTGKYGGEM